MVQQSSPIAPGKTEFSADEEKAMRQSSRDNLTDALLKGAGAGGTVPMPPWPTKAPPIPYTVPRAASDGD